MKVRLEGLDCPNCARALENEINKLPNVKHAKIEFIKNSLQFECNPNVDENQTLNDIIKLTKQLEPEARIITNKTNTKNKGLVLDLILLSLGITLAVVLIFVSMPKWLFWLLYITSALLLGYKTYIKAIKQLFKGVVNENLLITISVIGASFVSQHLEGIMVIALYSVGKIFENLAVNRSRKSIESLVKMQPEYATLATENGEQKVEPSVVEIGSKIIVKAGEKVPIDGVIYKGTSAIDMQSLTGESVPLNKQEGDEILSGAVVLNGSLEIVTTKAYSNSTIKKITNLIETANENKSKTETFISKITKWYTLGVVVLALLVWGIVWAVTKNFNTAIYRGLIFLVISCPCAFAISVPLAYFSGLGNASKNGILIKGSNYLDACAKVNCVVFDKTGTLTTGQFSIDNIVTYNNRKEEEILFLASIGEQNSIHPLAKAIVTSYNNKLPKAQEVKEVAGEGVYFSYKNVNYFVGRKNKQLKTTAVELYEKNTLLGVIYLNDTIKHTAQSACSVLNKQGINTVMLSGDNEESVKNVCANLGIKNYYASLLPEEKYNWIKSNKTNKDIAYVGDGINDAPSLVLANVGISMGVNGSPASIEASDIVLVDDNPEKVAMAIKISKYTRKIVLENIGFSAFIKVLFLSLGAFGVTGMLSAVFADVGVTLLAILNSMRALKFKPKKCNSTKCNIKIK